MKVFGTPYRCDKCKAIQIAMDGERVPTLCEQIECNKNYRRWLDYHLALHDLLGLDRYNLAMKIRKAPVLDSPGNMEKYGPRQVFVVKLI